MIQTAPSIPSLGVSSGRKRIIPSMLSSDVLDEDTKAQLGIDQPRILPPAPKWITDYEEGFDNQKQIPRIEGVDKAPEWMKSRTEGVDLAPEFMKQKPITTYIGKNAKGWNDTEEGKFSRLGDNMQRREISDEGAVLRGIPPPSVLQTVGDVLSHKKLFEQYPDLKDIKFMRGVSPQGSKAAYISNMPTYGKTIILDYEQSIGDTPEEATSPVLHELQHAIQDKEGFSRGGSPEEFEEYNKEEMERINKEQAERLKYLLREGRKNGLSDSDVLNSPEGKIIGENLSKLQKEIRFPVQQYRELSGEVESRDVQARKDMSDALRARTMPYSSQGIPVNKQIVRFR